MNIYALTDSAGDILPRDQVEELLDEIGIPQELIDKGSSEDIQAYATENNIDLSQLTSMAKNETQNKVNGSAATAKGDYEKELKTLGIPEDIIRQGSDAVAVYAAQNGIQLPDNKGTKLNLET